MLRVFVIQQTTYWTQAAADHSESCEVAKLLLVIKTPGLLTLALQGGAEAERIRRRGMSGRLYLS